MKKFWLEFLLKVILFHIWSKQKRREMKREWRHWIVQNNMKKTNPRILCKAMTLNCIHIFFPWSGYSISSSNIAKHHGWMPFINIVTVDSYFFFNTYTLLLLFLLFYSSMKDVSIFLSNLMYVLHSLKIFSHTNNQLKLHGM